MLHNTKDLVGYGVGATDGAIGHVKDVYFDDGMWVVRYLVVDAGSWLSAPMSIPKNRFRGSMSSSTPRITATRTTGVTRTPIFAVAMR